MEKRDTCDLSQISSTREIIPTATIKDVSDIEQLRGEAKRAMQEIERDPWAACRFTNKENMLAIASNSSGLSNHGNIGALAGKPLMEEIATLYKIFADINAFDIEINEEKAEGITATIKSISPTFGAIALYGIDDNICLAVEQRLRNLIGIPVLCADCRASAVLTVAATINSAALTARLLPSVRCVIFGSNAKSVTTARLLLQAGVKRDNITLCNRQGTICEGQGEHPSMLWEFLSPTKTKPLAEALKECDIFIATQEGYDIEPVDIDRMAHDPIFILTEHSNSGVEELLAQNKTKALVCNTAEGSAESIVAPYLFRGAMDALATEINEKMLLAAARAIATVATSPNADNSDSSLHILPTANDSRLITAVSYAVAKAAAECGIARRPIVNKEEYTTLLMSRMEHELHFKREIFGNYHREHLRHRKYHIAREEG